jgi:hypothetical protein
MRWRFTVWRRWFIDGEVLWWPVESTRRTYNKER